MQNRGQKYLPVFGLPRSVIEFLGIIISLLRSTQDVASLLKISDEMRKTSVFLISNSKQPLALVLLFWGFWYRNLGYTKIFKRIYAHMYAVYQSISVSIYILLTFTCTQLVFVSLLWHFLDILIRSTFSVLTSFVVFIVNLM
jgi:hypothetical protein